ncbi:MAG TPA: hypothetical protein VEQ41_04380 [Solirubrobacterales bacterium]|nr:hypothetical protein [Solirubrobacterales bacterium]
MRRAKVSKPGAALAALCVAIGIAATAAPADQVRLGPLVLTANGGFEPRLLPKDAYAPIRFQGTAKIEMLNGAQPPALRRLRLDFDRDGKLTTAGLATCAPESLASATPAEARRRCAAALVGTGKVEARVALPGRAPVDVSSPLSIFNGPRRDGNPTAVVHARNTFPATETFVVVVPIEQRPGTYRYRATFDVPEIAGGAGSITFAEARIGRRYRAGGGERSYVSARCSDGILQTLGLASFADGTVISGSLFKACRALP